MLCHRRIHSKLENSYLFLSLLVLSSKHEYEFLFSFHIIFLFELLFLPPNNSSKHTLNETVKRKNNLSPSLPQNQNVTNSLTASKELYLWLWQALHGLRDYLELSRPCSSLRSQRSTQVGGDDRRGCLARRCEHGCEFLFSSDLVWIIFLVCLIWRLCSGGKKFRGGTISTLCYSVDFLHHPIKYVAFRVWIVTMIP